MIPTTDKTPDRPSLRRSQIAPAMIRVVTITSCSLGPAGELGSRLAAACTPSGVVSVLLWPTDLLAEVWWLWLVTAGVGSLGLWCVHRRRSAAVCIGLFVTLLTALLVDTIPQRSLLDRPNSPPDLVVYIHNTRSENHDADRILQAAASSDADVIVLCESSSTTVRAARAGTPNHPHTLALAPIRGVSGWIVVMSKDPIEPGPALPAAVSPDGIGALSVRVLGEQPVDLVAIHAPSPRSPSRWSEGLAGTDALAQWSIRRRSEDADAPPLLIVGDLNAGPRSARGRVLGRALSPAKPLLAPGTFPASLPGVLRLAIDDAWHDPRLEPTTPHFTRSPVGSDHAPVTIGIRFTSD